MNNNIPKSITFMLVFFILFSMLVVVFNQNDKKKNTKENAINSLFSVILYDEKGSFIFTPEDMVVYMTRSIVPYEFISEMADESAKIEYYKALAVVCRTNLVNEWNDKGCPDKLDYMKTNLAQIILTDNIYDLKKIKEASKATAGVVITDSVSDDKDGEVIVAPFFTSAKGDLLAKQAGKGVGLSLNFAFVKAKEGLDYVDILQFFYGKVGFRVF